MNNRKSRTEVINLIVEAVNEMDYGKLLVVLSFVSTFKRPRVKKEGIH